MLGKKKNIRDVSWRPRPNETLEKFFLPLEEVRESGGFSPLDMMDMYMFGYSHAQEDYELTPEAIGQREEFERYLEYMYDGRIEKGSEIYVMLDKCARHFYNFGIQSLKGDGR